MKYRTYETVSRIDLVSMIADIIRNDHPEQLHDWKIALEDCVNAVNMCSDPNVQNKDAANTLEGQIWSN